MSNSFWLIVIFVATIVCNTNSRPQNDHGTNYYRVHEPPKYPDQAHANSGASTTQTVPEDVSKPGVVTKNLPNIEAIAVVARATSDRPSPMAADTGVGQMVESDIRTPPKLKEMIQEKMDGKRKEENAERSDVLVDRIEANGRFELPDASERANSYPYMAAEGKGNKRKDEDIGVKGIAVPVFMDEFDAESAAPPKKLQKIPDVSTKQTTKDDKKKSNPKPVQNPTTTPSSGLSTWILLSDNRDTTTSQPKKNMKKEPAGKPDEKKTVVTTKKPGKVQMTTIKPASKTTLVTKMGVVTPKPDKKPESETENFSALEAMVKNQKKNGQTTKMDDTTKTPVQKKQTTMMTTTGKPNRINDRMDVAQNMETDGIEARRPSTIAPMLATQNPTTLSLMDQQGNGQTTTDPTVESTTKKKKSGSKKKKKKNKNRRRTPTNGTVTQIEQKTATKTPKQPPSTQFYNFLSREIMPTVGLGLVGVLVTAGLAGLLGYNPFVSGNLPVRRTYEIHHGYSPNNYYSYNTPDYNDGGQSEEALFREVLSGMPEGSRYGLSNTENSYPESQIYSSQDQVYDAMKGQGEKKYQGSDGSGQYQYPESKTEDEGSSYDGAYSQDYGGSYGTSYDSPEMLKTRENSNKYPTYDREVGASYVYPEGTGSEKSSRLNDEYDSTVSAPSRYGSDKISSKYSKVKTDTIERQPEALYRVAGDYDHTYRSESTVQGISSQNSWHRMGSAMDYTRYSRLEPGPRSLNLTKEEMLTADTPKKRTKRDTESVIQRIERKGRANKDAENEIDFEGTVEDEKVPLEVTTERSDSTTETEEAINATTEADYDVIETNPIPYNFLDVLKRLAQYKLKIGLNFLRSTTDAFSRYLDVIQKRVDESITNTTLVYRIRRNPDVKSRLRRSPDESKKRNKKPKISKRKGDRKNSGEKH